MKRCIIASIVLLAFFAVSAKTTGETNLLTQFEASKTAVVSRSTNVLAIVYQPPVYEPTPEGTRIVLATEFDSSKPIHYRFFSTTNTPRFLYMLRPEYRFRITASTATGQPLELTRQGRQYGYRFDTLKGYERDAMPGKLQVDIAGKTDSFPGLGPRRLPAPDQLFRFRESGKYFMTIEAACFAAAEFPPPPGSMRNSILVKFPRVRICIVKKATAGE